MKIRWFIVFIILSACVDRINFTVPSTQFVTVVEGMITDSPGPYTLKVSKSISVGSDSSYRDPIQNVKIALYDDEGNSENFTETSPGVYITGGVIRGQVGHAYHITMETPDGKTFASEPDVMNAVGEVEAIHFQYQAGTVQTNYGEIDANIFNIFIDANAGTGNNNYVRWRFTGTYKLVTHPDQNAIWSDGYILADPPPCSGYIVAPGLGGGLLTQVSECTCCTCWINQYESAPQLSDEQFISNSQFKNIKVGEVPINGNTFIDKYMVEVDQMSLSKNAFDFFKLIRAQKEGATSLFQPPYGEITGNINPLNSSEQIVGLFWATSIKSKVIFILPTDVPYKVPPPDYVTDACTDFANSSNTKPQFW